jgi:hypothetical protein
MIPGCYAEVTGIVVDAETGQPIEGAVVLVEWTRTKGLPGLTHTESYKVVELVSDKEGKATLPEGGPDPLTNPPIVTVYKKGYVAWNNEYIFPGYKERTDFKWREGFVFTLEKFKPEYSYKKHVLFIATSIRSQMATENKGLMNSAIQWEKIMASRE